ncbi:unnamed protein product [Rotaria sp. Silwood2]|nr:unnamed protein product [Rotaria sp. Silwood2]
MTSYTSGKMKHYDNIAYLTFSTPPVTPTVISNTHQRSFFHSTLVKKAVHAFKGGTETTSERRAMKVLGIVFFVFLVAWLPFSILNILSAVCPSYTIKASLLNLTSWLGYISSNLNPIIYTAFNVRFRRAFLSILTCQTNYFSHKRKGNNLYIFVANNSHQKMPMNHGQYFFPSRRFLNERVFFVIDSNDRKRITLATGDLIDLSKKLSSRSSLSILIFIAMNKQDLSTSFKIEGFNVILTLPKTKSDE